MRNRLTIFCLIAVFAAIAVAAKTPGSRPGTNGSYKVVCRGSYQGQGNVAVGATNVNINVDVTDVASGAPGKLQATLDVFDGRFSGAGTLMGMNVDVCGRIDAPDSVVVLKPRICIMFSTPTKLHGRMAGDRKGP